MRAWAPPTERAPGRPEVDPPRPDWYEASRWTADRQPDHDMRPAPPPTGRHDRSAGPTGRRGDREPPAPDRDGDADLPVGAALAPAPTAPEGGPTHLSRHGRPGRARRRPPMAGPRPELPDVPALDGLRTVGLAAVLAFHQGFALTRGGFLAMSSALTLSGFLVATTVLAEWARDGSLGLVRFWADRARRLAPTFVVVVAAVVALQVTLRVGSGPAYRGDVLAALGQALNWRYAVDGGGFARVFTDPSPVQHLWVVSLSAQVTLVLPLALLGLARLTGAHWWRAGAVVALAAGGSFAAAWATAGRSGNDGLAYFGLHTRVGEVLVGVVLAYAVASPGLRRATASPTGARALRLGTPLAVAGLAVLWCSTGLYSANLFGGITALNAVLTAWVVLAATRPGALASVLGRAPLRLVGRVAYAAFLAHWPLFLLLDEDRTGLDGPVLFAARVAATLVAAAVLTLGLERLIRHRRDLAPSRVAVGLVAALAAVAVTVVALPQQPPWGVELTVDDGSGPGDLDVVVPSGQEALSVALVGGSLAGSLVPGFEAWNGAATDRQVRLATHVAADCPLTGAGPVRLVGRAIGDDPACRGFRPRLPHLLDAADPDVVVVVPGVGDLGEREVDNRWVHPGEPVFDTWARQRLDELAGVLGRAGVPVVWATTPHVRLPPAGDGGTGWTDVPDNDPARVDSLNEIVRAAAAGAGHTVVDLADWAQRLPRGEFGRDDRAEGRDLTPTGAGRAVSWLVPQLLEAAGVATGTGDGPADVPPTPTTTARPVPAGAGA